jgi:hypothetical protein
MMPDGFLHVRTATGLNERLPCLSGELYTFRDRIAASIRIAEGKEGTLLFSSLLFFIPFSFQSLVKARRTRCANILIGLLFFVNLFIIISIYCSVQLCQAFLLQDGEKFQYM